MLPREDAKARTLTMVGLVVVLPEDCLQHSTISWGTTSPQQATKIARSMVIDARPLRGFWYNTKATIRSLVVTMARNPLTLDQVACALT